MTDTARDPRIADLIDFAVNSKPVEFQNTFNDIVSDRLLDKVGERKAEVAQVIFEPQAPEPDKEENTDGEIT